MAHPSSFYKSYKSYKSYASATPTQHAYPRCHQVALHYPAVNLPVALPQRHILPRAIPHCGTATPKGYHMTCHGVARQGEDGRTHLVRQVRQVRQVRHKCHAPATRIPPLPSNRQAYPTGTFAPEPNHTAAPQTHGVSHGAPITLPTIPKKSQKFPCKRHAHADSRPPLPSSCPAVPNGNSSPEPNNTVPLVVAATSRPLLSFFCQAFFHLGNYPRAFRGSPEGVTNPLWRLQQRCNRYLAFFATLFFTWKKSVKGGDRCRRGGWSRRLRGFAFQIR